MESWFVSTGWIIPSTCLFIAFSVLGIIWQAWKIFNILFFCFWLWLHNQRFECFVPIPILPFLCLCPRPLCLQSFSLSLYSPLTNQSTKTFAITQESKIPSWRFPSWRRSKDFLPEEGNGHPLQNSCLGNPMDRVAWWAEVHRVMQSWTRLKQVSSKSPCISSPHTTSASIQRRSVNVLL